jgi:hypothetical protein
MLSKELNELVEKAKAHNTPNDLVGSVVETVGIHKYDVSILTRGPGWVAAEFRKVKEEGCNRNKKPSEKRSKFNFPDASSLCVVEHLESALKDNINSVARIQNANRAAKLREDSL